MSDIIINYTLKKTLPNQALLHSRWNWNKYRIYYISEFTTLFRKLKVKKVKAFELELRYNTRHDCDNLAPFTKFFVDAFVRLKLVEDDNRNFYKSLKLIPDTTLPKKTLQFKIIPHAE